MTDLSTTITPKSDQLNADDLIGRNLTITVTKVSRCAEAEQPIAINFDGDGGKSYKPCKSMRRLFVQIWGKDGTTYVGKSMTLYRDPEVSFGGMKVGGIRISHMSNLDKPVTMALTESKAKRKPFTVKPLVVGKKEPDKGPSFPDQLSEICNATKTSEEWVAALVKGFSEAPTMDDVAEISGWDGVKNAREDAPPEVVKQITDAIDAAWKRHRSGQAADTETLAEDGSRS